MELTSTAKLAVEYLHLSGRRRVKTDDSHASMRLWAYETRAAETFWNERIAPLDEARRERVITHLPTINPV